MMFLLVSISALVFVHAYAHSVEKSCDPFEYHLKTLQTVVRIEFEMQKMTEKMIEWKELMDQYQENDKKKQQENQQLKELLETTVANALENDTKRQKEIQQWKNQIASQLDEDQNNFKTHMTDDLSFRLLSLNSTIETFLGGIETNIRDTKKQVAFSVYDPSSKLTSDNTPTFTQKYMNTGSYDMATGKFTCPVAGIYIFSLTLRHDHTNIGNPHCWYRVNGATKSYVQTYVDAYDQSSGTIIVTLSVDDVVDMQCTGWQYEQHSTGTIFSGALITPT